MANAGALPTFHQRQRACILQGVSAGCYCSIIATMFSFYSNAMAHPPHCWMVKEHCFREHLEQVYECVKALDVSKFVRDQQSRVAAVTGASTRSGAGNYGTKPANHRWYVDVMAFAIRDNSTHAESALQCHTALLELNRHWFCALPLQTTQHQEATCGSQAQSDHSSISHASISHGKAVVNTGVDRSSLTEPLIPASVAGGMTRVIP